MPTQVEVGVHLDVDQSTVSRVCAELEIDWRDSSMDEIRTRYIRHLRGIAAGRAAAGGLDLATERARLASAQAERVERANAIERGELAPMVLLEQVLARTGAKIAGVLDGIPGQVRRRVPLLPMAALDLIAAEVAKARNTVAAMSLSDLVEPIGQENDNGDESGRDEQ